MKVYTKIELTWDETTQQYFKSAEESYDYIGPVEHCGGGGGGGFGGIVSGGGGGKGFSPLSIVGQLAGGVLSGAMGGQQESAPTIQMLAPPPAPIVPPTVDDTAVRAQQETERRRLATQGRKSTISSDFLALENQTQGTSKTLLG